MGQTAPVAAAAPTQVVQQQMGQVFYMAQPMQMMPAEANGAVPAPMQSMPIVMTAAVPQPVQQMAVMQAAPAVAAPAEAAPVPMARVDSTPEQVKMSAGRQLMMEAFEEDQQPDATLPSLGSALHGTGKCQPCAWYWNPKRCANGAQCEYCHLCPEGELKARKKAKVAALKAGAIEPVKKGTIAGPHKPAATLKLNALI